MLVPAEWERAETLDDVECWRVSQLMLHGSDFLTAVALAANRAVDLHAACDLLDRGCPPETVVRILP